MPKFSVNPVALELAQSKADSAEADVWFEQQILAGFDTGEGFTLGLTETDVTLLTGNYVLAKEADAMEMPLAPIIDSTGVPHQLTMAKLTEVMLAYGAHRAALSQEYAEKKAAAVFVPPEPPSEE